MTRRWHRGSGTDNRRCKAMIAPMSGRRRSLSISAALTGVLALLVATAATMSRAPAQATPADNGARAERAGHVTASLLAAQDAAVPGSVLRLGVRLVLEAGWHVYAAARNDSGLPVLVRPELPPGWEADPVLWPVPHRHLSPGPLLDHVYEDEVLLMFDVRVPADAQPGDTVTLRAHLEWLVCDQACVVGGADVALPLLVAAPESSPSASASAALFAATATRLPEAWPTATDSTAPTVPTVPTSPIRAERLADAVRLVAPGATTITLLPAEDCAELPFLVDEGTADGDTLRLHLARDLRPGDRLKGWVDVRYASQSETAPARARFFVIDLPLAETTAPPDAKLPPSRTDPVPVPNSGEPR